MATGEVYDKNLLQSAATTGVTPIEDFLEWIANRLVNVHHESPNVDYVLSLRERAGSFRQANIKATPYPGGIYRDGAEIGGEEPT